VLKNFLDRILNKDGSVSISDPAVIRSFTDNPDFPYLVSFSRTGSHWLRMIMELYFEKPALSRIFYFKNATDFTCYHRHDMELELRRQNVIYLYRNLVETIYSQLRYYNEDPDDAEKRRHWTDLYAQHLSKWLVHDDFTNKKTVLTYEGMKTDMTKEFAKVCRHFGQELDASKLEQVLEKVSKGELKKKTTHDQRVVNLSEEYQLSRAAFANKYSERIIGEMYSIEPGLKQWLEPHTVQPE
jgi:hypothetical protein